MDSLRYWLTEMRVDGFRFDLAPTLARQDGSFDRVSAFFDLVSQDPVVSRAKLIAEPWDVGQVDSYDIGRFPPLWGEWNGRYRDTMRDFWRSHDGLLGDFATRLTGSSDLYGGAGRRPTASVNLITVHDGFTLADLVSYDTKHNEANGEGNRDGTDDNRSWNCGVEGPTDDRDDPRPAQPAEPSHARHPAAVVRRPDARRRGRARPHPAGQQQRLLPGQRDHLVRLVGTSTRTCSRSPGNWWRSGGTTPCSGGAGSWSARRPRSSLGSPRPAPHDRGRTGGIPTPAASRSTSTAPTRPTWRADGSPMVDDDFLCWSTPGGSRSTFTIPPTRPGQTWCREIDTFDPAAAAVGGKVGRRRSGRRRAPLCRRPPGVAGALTRTAAIMDVKLSRR